jgi:tetratricopeptide (TPR) repeat protein
MASSRDTAPAWRTHDHGWAVVSGAPGREVLVVSSGLPLVGRRRERGQLIERIERARQGEPQFIVVRGTAGIGKTRVLREVDALATEAHFAVCLATTWEHDELAYLPFTATLLPHVQRTLADDPTVTAELRAAITITAGQRVDRTGRADADTDPLNEQRSGDQPAPATQALLRLIPRAARRRPLAIVIDDIQWADPSSLDLLQRLATMIAGHAGSDEPLPLLIVASLREDAGHPEDRASFAVDQAAGDQPSALIVDLDPLDDIESRELAKASWFGRLSSAAIDSIVTTAEGNPLFITTLAGSVGSAGQTNRTNPDAAIDVELPERMTASINERIGQLSQGCRDLLILVSMLADHGTIPLLRTLDLDDTVLEDRIDEAVASGIIGRMGDRLAFTHPLFRHACYTSVATLMRKSLHLRIADALVATETEPNGLSEALVAHHLLAAGLLASTEKIITHARVAADRAFRLNAWTEATRYYEGTIEAWHRRGGADPNELIDLHLHAATCRSATSDLEAARRHAERSFELAELVDNKKAAAQATLARHRVEIMTGAFGQTLDPEPLIDIVEASYHDDPYLRSLALVEVSERAWLAGRIVEAQALAQKARVAAQASNMPTIEARALVSEATTHWIKLDQGAARQCLDLAVGCARLGVANQARGGDAALDPDGQPALDSAPGTLALALGRLAMTAWWSGDQVTAIAAADEACELSYTHHQPLERIMPLATKAAIAVAAGKLADADRHAYQALLLQRTSGDFWSSAFLYPVLASGFTDAGRWDEASLQLSTWTAEIDDGSTGTQEAVVGLLKLNVRAQRGAVTDDERDALASRAERTANRARPPVNLLVGMVSTAMAEVELADALQLPAFAIEPALVLEASLRRGKHVGASWTRLVATTLGRAERLLGRHDQAESHLREGLALAERLGAGPARGRAQLELARLLLERSNREEARLEAGAHLDSARAIFARHQLHPLLAAADVLASSHGF